MAGGMVASTLMELRIYPAIYCLWRSLKLNAEGK